MASFPHLLEELDKTRYQVAGRRDEDLPILCVEHRPGLEPLETHLLGRLEIDRAHPDLMPELDQLVETGPERLHPEPSQRPSRSVRGHGMLAPA